MGKKIQVSIDKKIQAGLGKKIQAGLGKKIQAGLRKKVQVSGSGDKDRINLNYNQISLPLVNIICCT
ncbi:MAG: hypothetical protein PVH48_08615 [Cyclobacteriaceae bacterium]|jgi:hypothetical protein